MSKFNCAIKKGDYKDRECSIEHDSGGDFKGALALFGEAYMFYRFKQAQIVHVQAIGRKALADSEELDPVKREAEVQGVVDEQTWDVPKGRLTRKERTAQDIAKMNPDQLREFIEIAEASLKE